MDALKK
jgi:serine/threonine protein kinase